MSEAKPVIQLYEMFEDKKSIQLPLIEYINERNSELFFGKYQIRKYLGKGSFARVFKAKNRETDKTVALKIIDLLELDMKFNSEQASEKTRKYLVTEEDNMKKCRSAYVLKIFESYTNNICKILVMEYCNGASLEHYLKRKGRFQERNAIIILKEIIFGLAEMHRNGIIHRDLKPANILIHNGIFKIADLGFSKELPEEQAMAQHTVLGTRSTMAPEVVNKQAYSFKADIWSLGVIFFIMLFYDRDCSLQQNYRKVEKFIELKDNNKLSMFDSQSVSLEAVDFLRRTLEINQDKRLDWQQTLEHSVFIRKDQILPESFLLSRQEGYSDLKSTRQKDTLIKNEEIQKEVKDMKQRNDVIPNEEEVADYQILNRQYFQCRKGEFLLNRLIVPIEEKQLIDKKNQLHLEMLYLLVNRCKNNITRAQKLIKYHYESQLCQIFSGQVSNLEERVKLKEQFVLSLLNAAESKIGSIIKDKMKKIIDKAEYNEKEKFLTGDQELQFTREQQVRFTYSKYILEYLKDFKASDSEAQSVKAILKAYEKIALLEERELNGMGFYNWLQAKILKN